jgi:hypothetical protein
VVINLFARTEPEYAITWLWQEMFRSLGDHGFKHDEPRRRSLGRLCLRPRRERVDTAIAGGVY